MQASVGYYSDDSYFSLISNFLLSAVDGSLECTEVAKLGNRKFCNRKVRQPKNLLFESKTWKVRLSKSSATENKDIYMAGFQRVWLLAIVR